MSRAIGVMYWLMSTRQQPNGNYDVRGRRKLKILLLLSVAALLLSAIAAAVPAVLAQGLTLTVNVSTDGYDINPGDGICDSNGIIQGNQCSLRAAIEELNQQDANETHRIEFDLAGAGPFAIAPASPLPMFQVPIEMNGASQPGATCPTRTTTASLLIILDGSNAGPGADGLVLGEGSDGSTVRGLVIGNFEDDGLRLVDSGNSHVTCNHIGLQADGVSPMANGTGIFLSGDGHEIDHTTSHASRNVISANQIRGMIVAGSGHLIANNFIGTTADGMHALGNDSDGIRLEIADDIRIGGVGALARNVISANDGHGIEVYGGNSHSIIGNYIGVARDGVTQLTNGEHGIYLFSSASNVVIGGVNPGEENVIAYNGRSGLSLREYAFSSTIPTQIEIRGNAVFGNGDLGIDLGGDGVDTNDPGDGDGGENERQNYPILQTTAGSSILYGTLNSQPQTTYLIDLYRNDSCDPSGYGEGQTHIFAGNVTTSSFGQALFSIDMASHPASPGDFITATATDPQGNTSEFSACVLLDYERAERRLTRRHLRRPPPSRQRL